MAWWMWPLLALALMLAWALPMRQQERPTGGMFDGIGYAFGVLLRVLVAVVVALVIALASAVFARASDFHSNPWLNSWIPATCCVTNDCCWEISEREVRSLPDDEWEIRSTGQVRKRTAWSPDGKFYRCACDYDNTEKHWNRHQGANTRCLFVPMRSAATTFRRSLR